MFISKLITFQQNGSKCILSPFVIRWNKCSSNFLLKISVGLLVLPILRILTYSCGKDRTEILAERCVLAEVCEDTSLVALRSQAQIQSLLTLGSGSSYAELLVPCYKHLKDRLRATVIPTVITASCLVLPQLS